MSFLVLTPAIVVVAYLFSRRTTMGRMAAQTFAAFGIAFVASTLAVGFPAGAAALYAAHHGVDAGSIATVDDIRNYSYVLQVALSAGMALALGIRCPRGAGARAVDRVGRRSGRRRWAGRDPVRPQHRLHGVDDLVGRDGRAAAASEPPEE